MDEETEEEDRSMTEVQARYESLYCEAEAAMELEATTLYGPPDVRTRKNQRYVARLVRKHSEQTIRELLKALSTLKEPTSAANLANYDLDAAPLAEIIQPFEIYGFHFSVNKLSGSAFTVDFGAGHGTCGSGGEFVLSRTESGTFHITEEINQWIA